VTVLDLDPATGRQHGCGGDRAAGSAAHLACLRIQDP
jgi:hypothetical protein